MKTQILSWTERNAAVNVLQKGELVCFPTETVYGIGAISSSEDAFNRLVEAKRRTPDKPFTLMCSSIGEAVRYAEVNVGIIAVMKKFLPGQLTLLLRARPGLPAYLTLGTPTIGIRVPDSADVLAMIEEVGCPLLVPSANRTGEKTSCSFEETFDVFDGEVGAIIQGECVSYVASTIVDLSGDEPKLIREGAVDFNEVAETYRQASMTVSVGADHGAFDLKAKIIAHLSERGIHALDRGTYSKASCDYPFFGKQVAVDVATGLVPLGIVCCTSGIGISIATNKIKGVRCAIGYDDVVTQKCREHNNANVISFGAKYMKEEDVMRRVDIFLSEKFSTLEKHIRRVNEIIDFEK